MNKHFAPFYAVLIIGASLLSAQSADTMKVIMTRGNIIVGDRGSDHGLVKGESFDIYKKVAGKLEKIATAETKVIDAQKCAMILLESNKDFPVAIDDVILPKTDPHSFFSNGENSDSTFVNFESKENGKVKNGRLVVEPIGYIGEKSDAEDFVNRYGWTREWIAKFDGRVISEKHLYEICGRPELAMAVGEFNLKSGALTAAGILLMAGSGFAAYKAFTYESEQDVLGMTIKYNDPKWGLGTGCTVLSSMGGTLFLLGMNNIGGHFTDFETAYRAAEDYNDSVKVLE